IFLEPGGLGSGTQPTWAFQDFTVAQGTAVAVTFLNEPDRQGPGEVSAGARNNGTVGLFYLEPGSLGSGTTQTWFFQNFPSAADAVAFLNEAPRQGRGQVSATPRNNGTVGLFYLEPGSLGVSATETWFFQNFPSAANAVAFLNEAPRQGPGEASAFLRDDGTVGLFYLIQEQDE